MRNFLNNIFLPIFTLFVCSRESLLYENVTYIANHTKYRYLVCLLAMMLSIHYFVNFKEIFRKTNFDQKYIKNLLLFSCLLITITFFIPYNTSIYPILSKFHVLTALGGSILFILLLNVYMWFLQSSNIGLYQIVFPIYLGLITGCISIFVWFGSVNSLVELFFILMINYLIYIFDKNTKKN